MPEPRAPRPAPPPLPKPDHNQAHPHPEDFAAWCEHPVTRFVARAFEAAAIKQRETWVDNSWTGGEAEPELLLELRTRADAYMAFMETGRDEYVAIIEG